MPTEVCILLYSLFLAGDPVPDQQRLHNDGYFRQEFLRICSGVLLPNSAQHSSVRNQPRHHNHLHPLRETDDRDHLLPGRVPSPDHRVAVQDHNILTHFPDNPVQSGQLPSGQCLPEPVRVGLQHDPDVLQPGAGPDAGQQPEVPARTPELPAQLRERVSVLVLGGPALSILYL